MMKRTMLTAAIFVAGVVTGMSMRSGSVVHAQGGSHVYEIRTYTTPDGKLDALKLVSAITRSRSSTSTT